MRQYDIDNAKWKATHNFDLLNYWTEFENLPTPSHRGKMSVYDRFVMGDARVEEYSDMIPFIRDGIEQRGLEVVFIRAPFQLDPATFDPIIRFDMRFKYAS